MYDEKCLNNFNYNGDNNHSIIRFKDIYNNGNINIDEDEDEDEDEDIISRKELMYDAIQDNYNNMKNSLLIFRKRLINNQDMCEPLNDNEVKILLNNENNVIEENFIKRKKLNKVKIKHSKFSYDNMFQKIKVIYHKFIVSLSNDIYNNCESSSLNNIFIRRISGDITTNCNKGFNKSLGELTLKEFLSKSISSKYSNTSENVNRENIEIIYKMEDKYKPVIKLLAYTYKDFFQYFYIKDNCIELIENNFNIKKRSYICFKESVKKLSEYHSIEYINKFVEVANDKFIRFLEGKSIKRKK